MRKIPFWHIFAVSVVFIGIIAAGGGGAWLSASLFPLGDFREISTVLLSVLYVYGMALGVYRLFLRCFPLSAGPVPPDSSRETIYNIYILFNLIFFYPVTFSGILPVPVFRLWYRLLGARLGENTYSSGIIMDPCFVTIGDNSLVGLHAKIIPHVVEGTKLAHYPVTIGSNVTIGAGAVILSNVTIGDNALIGAGAVVPKNTVIGTGETWVGIPARKLEKGPARPVVLSYDTRLSGRSRRPAAEVKTAGMNGASDNKKTCSGTGF